MMKVPTIRLQSQLRPLCGQGLCSASLTVDNQETARFILTQRQTEPVADCDHNRMSRKVKLVFASASAGLASRQISSAQLLAQPAPLPAAAADQCQSLGHNQCRSPAPERRFPCLLHIQRRYETQASELFHG